MDSAPVVCQVSDDDCPAGTEVGCAESVQVGGGSTVTVAWHVEVWPSGVETVAMYVVVFAGVTLVEPVATGVTAPIP